MNKTTKELERYKQLYKDLLDGYEELVRDNIEKRKATAGLISRLRDHVAACGKSLTNKGKALRDEATAWLKENE